MRIFRAIIFLIVGASITGLFWVATKTPTYCIAALPFTIPLCIAIAYLPAFRLRYLSMGGSISIIICVGICFFIIGGLVAFLLFRRGEVEYLPILVTALFATFGWMATTITSIRNQRKQHTMTVLMQMRESTLLAAHKNNLYARFGTDVKMDKTDLPELENKQKQYWAGKQGASLAV